MLQHHLLLSFTKWAGRKQLLLRVNFIQVFTRDRRLIHHLTSRCLQCWDKTKGILLKEPVRFVFQVNIDDVMSDPEITGFNLTKAHFKDFHDKVWGIL